MVGSRSIVGEPCRAQFAEERAFRVGEQELLHADPHRGLGPCTSIFAKRGPRPLTEAVIECEPLDLYVLAYLSQSLEVSQSCAMPRLARRPVVRRDIACVVLCCAIAAVGCTRDAAPARVRLADLWVAAHPAVRGVAPAARMGLTTRIGIPVPVGESVRIALSIPRDALLRGYIGLAPAQAERQGAEATIDFALCASLEPEDRGNSLGRFTAVADTWQPIELRLEGHLGGQAGLCFTATGGKDGAGFAADHGTIWLANASLERRDLRAGVSRGPNLILVTQHPGRREEPVVPAERLPGLARLLREGELYANAVFNSAAIGAATASLFSGLHPGEQPAGSEAAAASEAGIELSADVLVLPELFWALGHGTAGIVSEAALGSEFGFARAFDAYHQSSAAQIATPALERAGPLAEIALDWIRTQPGSFFLFLNFPSADGSGDPLDRGMVALLRGLDELGLYDETLLAVAVAVGSAPQGPTQAWRGAATGLLESELRHQIYLKRAGPPSPTRRGRRHAHRVDSLDLHASLLREFGLTREGDRTRDPDAPPAAPGRYGLSERRRYHRAEWGRRAGPGGQSESRGFAAVYREQWKLVRDGRGGSWLFDLSRDPRETANLLERHASVATRLGDVLDAWAGSQPPASPRDQIGRYPPALVELMRKLR